MRQQALKSALAYALRGGSTCGHVPALYRGERSLPPCSNGSKDNSGSGGRGRSDASKAQLLYKTSGKVGSTQSLVDTTT